MELPGSDASPLGRLLLRESQPQPFTSYGSGQTLSEFGLTRRCSHACTLGSAALDLHDLYVAPSSEEEIEMPDFICHGCNQKRSQAMTYECTKCKRILCSFCCGGKSTCKDSPKGTAGCTGSLKRR